MKIKGMSSWKILLIAVAFAVANLLVVTQVTGLSYSEGGMADYTPMMTR